MWAVRQASGGLGGQRPSLRWRWRQDGPYSSPAGWSWVMERAGAGWVEATEGDYITHRKMAALGKGMALADTEILRALPDSARLVAIFTDSVTARGTYLAFFRSLAPPGINSAPIACVAVPRCSHGCSGFSIHPPSSKGEPCNTGGIVADLQEWSRDMFEFASLTAKLLRSSNS